MILVHVTTIWTILITLHDVLAQNNQVCQYSVKESPEGGLRISIGT